MPQAHVAQHQVSAAHLFCGGSSVLAPPCVCRGANEHANTARLTAKFLLDKPMPYVQKSSDAVSKNGEALWHSCNIVELSRNAELANRSRKAGCVGTCAAMAPEPQRDETAVQSEPVDVAAAHTAASPLLSAAPPAADTPLTPDLERSTADDVAGNTAATGGRSVANAVPSGCLLLIGIQSSRNELRRRSESRMMRQQCKQPARHCSAPPLR